jgi:hypothetical protein
LGIEIKIVNPLEHPEWNELIASHPDSTIFHTSNWANVLSASYKYKPLYFTVIENDRLGSLIPFMGINSWLTGKRGVSLPFTDYCEPLIREKDQFQDLNDFIIEYGKMSKWHYFELRGGESFLHESDPSFNFYGHILHLSEDDEQVFSKFRNSTKRNIKKAVKEGVKVEMSESFESIKEYYRLHCITRKDHGLPPQPFIFFKNIYEHVISQGLGKVLLASYRNEIIAGTVYFHFGKKALYKYGASDKRFQHLRANNLVMWEAIKWYCLLGYKILSFGRTEPKNKGLMQFKAGWGTEERNLKYYKFNLKNESFVKGTSNQNHIYTQIFRKMPVSLLTMLGNVSYKHIG